MASTSKHQNSNQKLFIIFLLFISLCLTILVFSLNPETLYSPPVINAHRWFNLIASKINSEKIKIGLVNVDNSTKHAYDMHGLAEIVNVDFDLVSKDLKWENFFPEWIDEDGKWRAPKCPRIPMPSLEDYCDLDVIVARIPCGGSTEEGIRDVFRLQVNLVVANLVVMNGWAKPETDRTVYVVFIGSCGPMPEIFRCDDLLTHVGDYWVYKPELRKLKQKVLMPVGSCQMASPYAETGKEGWRYKMSESTLRKLNYTTYRQRVAYATVLHSSEAYVCGAIALAQSIIQTNSTKDLVLLHDSSLSSKSIRGLQAAGWKTRKIQPIRSPFAKRGSYNEWNYSKLRVWQLVDYDKVIFIDADILVLQNIDRLFLYPQLSASPNNKVIFNSGIMVLEPSMCTFENLVSKTSKLVSYNGGDQGFLNQFFTWWHRLPTKLNYLKVFESQRNTKFHEIPKDLLAIHYLGLKPWKCYRDYDCNWDVVDKHRFASDSAHKRWWQVYDAMPKNLQQYCALTKHSNGRIRKWRRIAKKAGLRDGHWKVNVTDPRQYHFVE